MGQLSDKAKSVFADGSPSRPNMPDKSSIIDLFVLVEALYQALKDAQVTGLVVFGTAAEMNANLAFAARAGAMVINDGANNGIYQKQGSSGSGSWAKLSSVLLPNSAQLTNLNTLIANLLGVDGLVDPLADIFTFRTAGGQVGFRFDPRRGFGVPGAWFRSNKVGGVRIVDDLGFAIRLVGSDGSLAGGGGGGQPIDKPDLVLTAPAETFVIAHRGFARLAPENTIAAWSEAARLHADAAECDIHMTSDGVPVVIHDDTVDRTTSGTGAVSSLTLAQIKALDAGTWFHAKFAGTKISTFQEFLNFCKGRFGWIYPEIKAGAGNSEVATIVNMITASGWIDRCVLTSFDPAVLAFARTISPNLCLGFTGSFDYISQAIANKPAILCINKDTIYANPTAVASAKAQGVDVAGWTVRSSNDRRKLNALGVTKLFCDVPV